MTMAVQAFPHWMENRVLMTALMISVGLHAIVLAIRFVDPELLDKVSFAPPIEVILVNARSERRPAQAQARAQVNLEGGGTNEQGRRSSPLPDTGEVLDGDALERARRDVARLEQEQRALLATYDA